MFSRGSSQKDNDPEVSISFILCIGEGSSGGNVCNTLADSVQVSVLGLITLLHSFSSQDMLMLLAPFLDDNFSNFCESTVMCKRSCSKITVKK